MRRFAFLPGSNDSAHCPAGNPPVSPADWPRGGRTPIWQQGAPV